VTDAPPIIIDEDAAIDSAFFGSHAGRSCYDAAEVGPGDARRGIEIGPPGRPLETDTLILIGDADDWTPAARCAKWRDAVQTHGNVLQMKIS
jgi:dienelactone hydrolase